MFWQSFKIGHVVTTQNYIEALQSIEIREAFTNSFKVSFVASVITTVLAFCWPMLFILLGCIAIQKVSANWNYLAYATANHYIWLCIDLYIWKSRNSNKISGAASFYNLWV